MTRKVIGATRRMLENKFVSKYLLPAIGILACCWLITHPIYLLKGSDKDAGNLAEGDYLAEGDWLPPHLEQKREGDKGLFSGVNWSNPARNLNVPRASQGAVHTSHQTSDSGRSNYAFSR